ncbi:MAG: hypothetical protein IK081_00325 [Lachnospiraceae bacterium]|nr:hypothetical protein [Lachnospiraceae bacterium]
MNEQSQENKKSDWKKYVFNLHTLLILIAVIIIVFIVVRLKNWGTRVDQDYIDQHGIYTDGKDTYDVIYPLTDEDGNLLANKNPHTILFFGNAPFADERDSENGVVNMIAKATGAKTYNCSVAGSYLAAKSASIKETDFGLDVYNFYWLTLYLTMDGLDYFDWLEVLPGAKILPETKQLRKTLETIDMSTVDTIAIMYDGSDYLAGSLMTNPDREDDIMSFTGNLLAGLRVLRAAYPKVRIIVLSPTYAFGVDENGNYVSSDQMIYEGGATLSSYVIDECSTSISEYVSFIDNIYGTFNEDEAPEYLKDNLHLNQKGRELLVKRFVSALTQFDQ